MAQLLIRNIKTDTVQRLKQRAKQHHRSLQGELQSIIEEAACTMSVKEMKTLSQKWHKHFKGRSFSDSTALLREDRNR